MLRWLVWSWHLFIHFAAAGWSLLEMSCSARVQLAYEQPSGLGGCSRTVDDASFFTEELSGQGATRSSSSLETLVSRRAGAVRGSLRVGVGEVPSFDALCAMLRVIFAGVSNDTAKKNQGCQGRHQGHELHHDQRWSAARIDDSLVTRLLLAGCRRGSHTRKTLPIYTNRWTPWRAIRLATLPNSDPS